MKNLAKFKEAMKVGTKVRITRHLNVPEPISRDTEVTISQTKSFATEYNGEDMWIEYPKSICYKGISDTKCEIYSRIGTLMLTIELI